MKKLLFFLMMLIIPVFIYAEEITTFSLNEVSSIAGGNVTIKLNMDNKQEFGVLTVRLHYDNTKLEYISSKINGLKAVLRGTDKNVSKGLVVLYAINLGDNLMNDSGNVWTIDFKVKDDVKEDIPLSLEIKDFGKDESNKLKYEKKDGLIKIKESINTIEKNKTDNLSNNVKENEKVIWSSTDKDVAIVDENGNVSFTEDGNVTIEAKNEDGKVIFSKDYFVKEKSNNYLIWYIAGAILLIVISIITWRIICQRKK